MIIDLIPTPDQQLLIESVGGYLSHTIAGNLPPSVNPEIPGGGEFWAGLTEMGVFGLALDEEAGGVGYSLSEEVLVAREFGRSLVPLSVLATMLAVHVAAKANDSGLVARLVSGEKRIGFGNLLSPLDPTMPVRLQLMDAVGADLILLWNDETSALIDRKALGDIIPVEGMDESITVERATLPAGATFVAGPITGDLIGQHASLLIAAYLVGMAEAARDMAVDYAKIREQFGQPIGAFQAVKHICADMAVRAEAAMAQTFVAAVTAPEGLANAGFETACARRLAGIAALDNAKANVQVHGGMGFTFECHAHLYLKRAHVLSVLNSGSRHEQQNILAGKIYAV